MTTPRPSRRLGAIGAVVVALAAATMASAGGCSGCTTHRSRATTIASPWQSPAACAMSAPLERSLGAHRIGTWNVRWFPDGTFENEAGSRRTDVSWLACAIAHLDVDVLAIQEFKKHERAEHATLDLIEELDATTGGRWQVELDGCPHENQPHVGFLYDATAVQVLGGRDIGRLNPHEGACDGAQRPGLALAVRFADGVELVLVNVHAKSGTSPRDRRYRLESVEAMAAVYRDLADEWRTEDVLFLGDFNTNGCPDCAESISATDEVWDLESRLRRFEPPLHVLPSDDSCTEYEAGTPWPLDHVVGPLHGGRVETSAVHVDGFCHTLHCSHDDEGELPAAHRRLSDHCPLVFEVRAREGA